VPPLDVYVPVDAACPYVEVRVASPETTTAEGVAETAVDESPAPAAFTALSLTL
jgi:hypothetical protein